MITFGDYGRKAIEKRRKEGLSSMTTAESVFDLYLEPRFGARELGEVSRQDFRAFLGDLRTRISRRGKPLAPRSIKNIVALLHNIFEDAVDEELIARNPCVPGRRDMPKQVDADPLWRRNAVYSRSELIALLSDPRISEYLRVLFGIHALAGPRSGELAALRWCEYDPKPAPLGCIVFARSYSTSDAVIRSSTKTGVARPTPVHAVLAKILQRWSCRGWKETFGRDPKPEDLIVPRSNKADAPLRNDGLYQRLEAACEEIGVPFHGAHALRASFISLAQEDGAPSSVIMSITHPNIGSSRRGNAFDGYSRFPWSVMCEAVAKIRLDLPETPPAPARPRSRVTKEVLRRARLLLVDGVSLRECARKLGLPYTTLLRAMKRGGSQPLRRGRLGGIQTTHSYPSKVVLNARRSPTLTRALSIDGTKLRIGRCRPFPHRLWKRDGKLWTGGSHPSGRRGIPPRCTLPEPHRSWRTAEIAAAIELPPITAMEWYNFWCGLTSGLRFSSESER